MAATLKPPGQLGVRAVSTGVGRRRETDLGELADQVSRPPVDIVLADNLREPIMALEETAFLLTVAWPAGAGAWEQELNGHHV